MLEQDILLALDFANFPKEQRKEALKFIINKIELSLKDTCYTPDGAFIFEEKGVWYFAFDYYDEYLQQHQSIEGKLWIQQD